MRTTRYASALASALLFVVLAATLAPATARGQSPDAEVEEVEKPTFEVYDPPSTLVVPETEVPRAKYPFVDVHSHQWRMGEPDTDLQALGAQMDALGLAVMVNLSGRGFRRVEQADGTFRFGLRDHDYLASVIDRSSEALPGRVLVFTNVDFGGPGDGVGSDGWLEHTLAQLERDVAAGAVGLKIYKNLGLEQVDAAGERLAVDDPRLDPLWAKCGALGIPVLIHTGEPASFWDPKDGRNERLLEMIEKPERWRGDGTLPPFEEVMAEQHAIFRRHPQTTFVNAHFGWMANDLDRLGALLDELPNVYVEFGAVIAELGRQPRHARRWMIEHQDRILFGKDSWAPTEYPLYFRVLETDDDYIHYFRRRHAFWRLYGLDLPDDVLRKIYYENALRLFPQIDRSLFPTS